MPLLKYMNFDRVRQKARLKEKERKSMQNSFVVYEKGRAIVFSKRKRNSMHFLRREKKGVDNQGINKLIE